MVEGFTSDPHQLLAALNHKDWGGMPQTPHLQTSVDEVAVEQQALAKMADMARRRAALFNRCRIFCQRRGPQKQL